jgi:hypothetical protein
MNRTKIAARLLRHLQRRLPFFPFVATASAVKIGTNGALGRFRVMSGSIAAIHD